MKPDVWHDPLFLAALAANGKGGTASGSIVTFRAYGNPLRSLHLDINPVQSGSGDPAPDNIRPISGWTGANVFSAGRNMFDEAHAVLYDRFINMIASPKLWSYDEDASSKSVAFPCKPNTTYTISCRDPDAENPITRFRVAYLDTEIPSAVSINPAVSGAVEINQAGSATLTTGANATYIIVQINAAILSARSSRLQIELGSTATAYEPYIGTTYPITIPTPPGTVYGGYISVGADGSSELVVDRALRTFTGQESWEKFSNDNSNGTYFGLAGTTEYTAFADDPGALCSINKRSSAAALNTGDGFYWTSGGWRILYGAAGGTESLDNFKTYLQQMNAAGTPVTICAKLATPITYSLSGITVQTLDGQNTMWGDSGDISVEWGNGGRISKSIMLAAIMNDRR